MTTKLSEEQREKLDGELKALKALENGIRKQREPFDRMLRDVEGLVAQTLERYGVDGDPIGHCESCETLLVPGDLGCNCVDGPVLCADCAPTWGDLKKQLENPIVTIDLDVEDEKGVPPREHMATIAAHIAGGGSLDDKIIHPL